MAPAIVAVSSGRTSGLVNRVDRTGVLAVIRTYPSSGTETEPNKLEKSSRTAPSEETVRCTDESVAPAELRNAMVTATSLLLVLCTVSCGISALVLRSNGRYVPTPAVAGLFATR